MAPAKKPAPRKKPAAKKKNWVAGAIKRPGALTAKAKAAGAYHNNKIDASWLAAQARKPGRTGRQARLAKTMRGFKK